MTFMFSIKGFIDIDRKKTTEKNARCISFLYDLLSDFLILFTM